MPPTRFTPSPSAVAVSACGVTGPAMPIFSVGLPKAIAWSCRMPESISRMRPSAQCSTNAGWQRTYGSLGAGSLAGSSTAERCIGWLAVSIHESRTGRSSAAAPAKPSRSLAVGNGARSRSIARCAWTMNPPGTEDEQRQHDDDPEQNSLQHALLMRSKTTPRQAVHRLAAAAKVPACRAPDHERSRGAQPTSAAAGVPPRPTREEIARPPARPCPT